jgi:tetratricopeptide (TPR) repeat protein
MRLPLRLWRAADRPTFTRDIAVLGFKHCAPCHRPGQSGPFSLLSYDDYRAHARDIVDVTEERYMPPWKPRNRPGTFQAERGLSAAEIALFRRWFEQGRAQGDARDLPEPPRWPSGWSLGEPDVVVQLPAAYALAPSGDDEYRNFVIPSPVSAGRWVVGWEFESGSRAIHHAILRVDRMGNARRADAADPAPGFEDMEFAGAQAPDGFYLVWAPGKSARKPSDGTAWRIDAATDLVLQLHLQRTGKTEQVNPRIALYLSDTAPSQRRFSLRIGDTPLDIPAGAADYRSHDSVSVVADLRLLALFPHAHYLAKRMRVSAQLPDGRELELLRIDDWDFNWQDEYTFVSPPLVPRGSTLSMEFSYDNSASNTHNPSRPPVRVRDGKRSIDEMGNVTFQALPVDPGALDVLLESKYRRQLGSSPSAEGLYNLANALTREGKNTDAEAYYREALAKKPNLDVARYNLAGLYLGQRDYARAIAELRTVLEHHPEQRAARLALGHALEVSGERAQAIAEYQRLLLAQPGDPQAQALLDGLLSR